MHEPTNELWSQVKNQVGLAYTLLVIIPKTAQKWACIFTPHAIAIAILCVRPSVTLVIHAKTIHYTTR